jgi:Tfp pilus assembly protein PilP
MDRRALVAGVSVLALVGCGGASRLTRAEFIKQANAICKHRAAAISAIEVRHGKDFRAALKEALPTAFEDLRKLEALKPPHALQDRYRVVMVHERAQLERVKRVLEGHRVGPGEGSVERHRDGRFRAQLGLSACV